jgi:hypothetical protein
MPIQVRNLRIIAPVTEEIERIFHPEQRPRQKHHQFAAQLEKEQKAKDQAKAATAPIRDQEQQRQKRYKEEKQEKAPEHRPEEEKADLIPNRDLLGKNVDVRA